MTTHPIFTERHEALRDSVRLQRIGGGDEVLNDVIAKRLVAGYGTDPT